MIIRKKTNRLWAIIGVCSLGLYVTACDSGELPVKEDIPANTELRFAVSISGNPSTRTVNGPAVMRGTAFPDGTHTFGMFITNAEGTPVVTGSGDNMKSILTRMVGTNDDWSHTDKNDKGLTLEARHGESIGLTGYYPWIAGATATAVPFDLTGEAATWQDLLYLSSPTGLQQVTDGRSVALTFSHAYCWVTVNLTKLTGDNTVSVQAVSIENSGNRQIIMNRGNMNPKTGAITGTASGPLTINCNPAISIPMDAPGGTPSEFSFLVPAFMRADVQDSDIVICVSTVTNGATEVLSFPLAKTHLNNETNQYGFRKGMHNTYNIVYNNSKMILSLLDWQEATINALTVGAGAGGGATYKATFNSQGLSVQDRDLAKITMGDHINHSYLGEVAEGNNREYVTLEPDLSGNLFVAWTPFLTTEPFYTQLMVAGKDAAGGGTVPWKDEITGVLRAKQACIEFRAGGYTDWRLPRISELYMLVYAAPQGVSLSQTEYWSATEHNADGCYAVQRSSSPVIGTIKIPKYFLKTARLYVRCVRDFDK